jgi:capsular exopolysaccharide synthesis family protein
LKFLFYTRVNSKFQIERTINKTPIISEIPSLRSQDNKIVDKYDNSPVAEGFRILRTNLSFFIKSKQIKKEKGSIVFVTSSTKGEGKTFVSSNLASVYAATGKKTLLVGTDLRNPQLHNIFNADKNEKGLSNYLIDEETNIDKLIKKDLMESNIDVMFSGPIPPNPSELLENPNLGSLFDELKLKYDHIVVDTAPTVLVSDTLLTTHLADVLVYVIRAEYTELRLLEHINKFKDFNKLINMGIVFNDISEENNYAYNYGYGYGYSASKVRKTGLKFWRN